MKEFVDDHDLHEFDHFADLGSELWRAFGVTAQPSYVFINDDGTFERHVGGLELNQLSESLDELLRS